MKSYLKLVGRLVYESVAFNINMPYYAVAVGRKVDIYPSWPECEAQVKGFKGAKFKKFSTENEARDFIDKNKDSEESGATPVAVEENKAKRLKVAVIDGDIHKVKVYKDHTFFVDESGYVIVYTDGSCTNNGKAQAKAGLGVYFGEEHALNVSECVSGRATNNCGEIQAATKAIKLAYSMGIDKLLIKTDSQFVINAVTNWMTGIYSKYIHIKGVYIYLINIV